MTRLHLGERDEGWISGLRHGSRGERRLVSTMTTFVVGDCLLWGGNLDDDNGQAPLPAREEATLVAARRGDDVPLLGCANA